MATSSRSQPQRRDSKQARIAAGVLLLHERSTRADIGRSVREATDQLTADMQRRRTENRAAALVAVVAASRWLAPKIQADIVRGRTEVRGAAIGRLAAELAAAGIAIDLARHIGAPRRVHEDDAHAESAASSLAAQWQGLAMAAAVKAHREERSVAASVQRVGPAMRFRIERTAATEVASAYNDEHARALEEARQHRPGLFAGLSVVRIWSAVLDRRTCEDCASRDGRIIEDGQEPPLHPLCRCVGVLMTTSEAASLAA